MTDPRRHARSETVAAPRAEVAWSLEDVVRGLAQHRPRVLPRPARDDDRAAVALVLAGPATNLNLCLIRRASRPDDHWSGHMALPGGWALPKDPTLQSVAERETCEEVGLRLESRHLVGQLSQVGIRHRGLDTDATLSPFVYYLGTDSPELGTSEEVAAAYWIPCAHIWNPVNYTRIEITVAGERQDFPGIRFDGQIIWGLTYRVLWDFSTVLDLPLPVPPRPRKPSPAE